MSDDLPGSDEETSVGRHAAHDRDGDAPTGTDVENPDGPGGTAASGTNTEGGGESAQERSPHTGYAPTDTGGGSHAVQDREDGDPAGMTATGAQSQGSGTDDAGRHHTGWGPADGEVN